MLSAPEFSNKFMRIKTYEHITRCGSLFFLSSLLFFKGSKAYYA